MFDLIDECGKDLKKFGYQVKRLDKFGMSLASLNVEDEKDRKNVGLEIGEYYIFNSPFIYEFGEENTNILEKGAEWCDLTIRCYLLFYTISEVVEELA